MTFLRRVGRLIGTAFVLALSLLPLSALLVALPAVAPNEAVLADAVPPARSWLHRLLRRVGGLVAGLTVLIGLFAFSVEAVSRMPLPDEGQLGPLAKKLLFPAAADALDVVAPTTLADTPEGSGKAPLTPKELAEKRKELSRVLAAGADDPVRLRQAEEELNEVERQIAEVAPRSLKLRVLLDPKLAPWLGVPIWKILPPALVQHWPFVFLVMYAADLGLLLLIGRVPLTYNVRNLIVRWRIAGLTALAFLVVATLLVVLLAFVNGMYKLNATTGIPGNVFVLSDGATDELFSNLGYGDVSNVARQTATLDRNGYPLPQPVTVARAAQAADGTLTRLARGEEPPKGSDAVYLSSQEIYFVVNQPIPTKPGDTPRRRFLNVRAMQDPAVGGMVHGIDLEPGGKWPARAGVQAGPDGKTYVQCVLGAGVAGTLGPDAGKAALGPGDTFSLGDLDWVVIGVMKAEGTTFGSEVWVQNIDLVTKTFGKKGNYTTLALRCDPDTLDASKALAYHLQNRYPQQKLKAFSEPEYYQELTKTNDTFLFYIILVAAIMAVGGVFGVMNTMFASIAARIKEVGVLRILGFKRWQILISFMLESLAIALVGGAIGSAFGFLADGLEARSTLSGGQGGGKSVSLKMLVDYQTFAAGVLFTLVMGRLGGLVPALSAMRMEILDSLR